MEVLHRSRDRLEIEHYPEEAITAMVAGAVFLPWYLLHVLDAHGFAATLLATFIVDFPLGIAMLVHLRSVRILFDRTADLAYVEERGIVAARNLAVPLSSVARIEHQTKHDSGLYLPAQGKDHRAVLVIAGDRAQYCYPVTTVFLPGRTAFGIADAVNRWMGREVLVQTPPAEGRAA